MQIGDLIRRAGRQYGDAPALIDGERVVSFAEFDELTDRLGNALLARGLAPGDRVAVLLPNGIDGVVAYYALAKSGLVRVPLNARETARELAFKIEDSQARALIHAGEAPAPTEIAITAEELPGLIESAPAEPCDVRREPDAPLRLAYTGGTTGKPKAVVLTTASELAEVANFLVDLLPNLHPGSVMLHAAPITHGSGAFFLPHLVKGAANVVLPKFSPAAFLEAACEYRATATFMVPTMIAMLLEDPATANADLALERICYGGAPIATTVLSRGIQLLGPVFAQLYGQAEAPLAITCLQPWEHTPERLTAAGKPYTFVEVQVRDTDGKVLGPGEVGEVLTRGPHTMSRYWRRPEATAATIEADGWLHTGDIGRWDDEGYLHRPPGDAAHGRRRGGRGLPARADGHAVAEGGGPRSGHAVHRPAAMVVAEGSVVAGNGRPPVRRLRVGRRPLRPLTLGRLDRTVGPTNCSVMFRGVLCWTTIFPPRPLALANCTSG